MNSRMAIISPADVGLEGAVLGACFHSAEIARRVAAEPPDIFFVERHREIHRTIVELAPTLNGAPPDVALVKANVGDGIGLDTLAVLFEAGMFLVDVVPHLKRLRELAAQREEEAAARVVNASEPGRMIDWPAVDDRRARAAALRALGETVILQPRSAPASRHLVERLLLDGETTVLFGDGGSGKSLFALAVALSVSTGVPLPCGFKPTRSVPVLLLDWESCREEHEDRLHRLCSGLGVSVGAPIYYRPMMRPLAGENPKLLAEARALQVGLIIIDSLIPASGAEPEGADAATRTMTAIRAFSPASRLVVSHVSKIAADQRGPSRPFGSVFTANLARATWELQKADVEGDLEVGLFNRKCNSGRLVPPLGLRIEFTETTVRLWPGNVAEQPDLMAKTSLTWRILKGLAGGALGQDELAEIAQAGKDTVERTLRRLRAKGQVSRLPDGRWALASR